VDVEKGSWGSINWSEFWGAIGMSAFIGVVRTLQLLRNGRKFVWFDFILEPALAVIGGMLAWGVTEVTNAADVLQAVFTSLGAWGGPKTIRHFERKYLGGTRASDFGDLGK
jgi:hypothetical protein